MAQPNQEKVKKVLIWVNECLDEDPTLSLPETFRKAEIKFDLTPLECAFIERNFTKKDVN